MQVIQLYSDNIKEEIELNIMKDITKLILNIQKTNI